MEVERGTSFSLRRGISYEWDKKMTVSLGLWMRRLVWPVEDREWLFFVTTVSQL